MKKRKLGDTWAIVKATFSDWVDDKAPRLGAAVSYYTLFSLAPILIIAIAIAGFIFGEDAARGQLVAQIQSLVGVEGAKAVEMMLESAAQPSTGVLATIVGIVTLLVGATGAFVELQDALNTVWEVRTKPGRGIKGLVRDRLLSFAMILGVGFLLLVSLVISAALTALSTFFGSMMPESVFLAQAVNLVLSFGVSTFLFAMIFKVLPDVKLDWSDVWPGALVTGVLFTLGKVGIGLYIGRGGVASAYGAAGSVVALLVWIYYTTQIVLLGAEYTQIRAEWLGRKIEPTAIAEYTPEHFERLKARGHMGAPAAPGALEPSPARTSLSSAGEKQIRVTPLPHRPRIRRLYFG